MPKARIIKIISNQYTLLTEDDKIIPAVQMGKMRLKRQPLVGDFVNYDALEGHYGMQEVLPRSNQLLRPLIANVDQALVVMSAIKPEFSEQLVDRLCFLIRQADIEPVLIVTKMDLIPSDSPVYDSVAGYRKSGMRVVEVGRDRDIDPFRQLLKGKISVLTGQSGVGKSSLINRLDVHFTLATQEISKALGRGKHTTRHTQLHEVAGGWIADTPGFSSIEFDAIDATLLEQYVLEFKPYLGECRFRNCSHENEPDCAVKKAVDDGIIPRQRYNHYLEVLTLCKQGKEKY